MKRILCLVLCALMLVNFSGCRSKSACFTYRSIENQNDHSFSMRYETFDGTKEYTIRVHDGQTLAVKVEIVTESGSLALTIAQKGEEPAYMGNDLQTTGFTVYLKEAGTYRVTLTADEHSGSYSFDWGE
ncbi:MAG: hypothetical protein ACI3V3_05890 [Faecousia sp.]